MNRNIVNYEVCRDTFPRTVNIDGGWKFQYGPFMPGDELSGKCTARTVNLPHDYMLEDNVCEHAPAAAAMGYYNGRVAYYSKTIRIPAAWKKEKVFLHFDGVMMNTVLEVNGCQVLLHHYGYTPFWADITPYLYWGEENRLTLCVNPSMQPNSRWYTGAGIFRSVELVHTPMLHIAPDGIFTETAPSRFPSEAVPLKDTPPRFPSEAVPPEAARLAPPAGGVHTAMAAANTRLTAAFPILFLISSAPPLLSPIRCPGRKAAPG